MLLNLGVNGSMPFNDRLSVDLGYRYADTADNASNLEEADFGEIVYGIALAADF